MTVPDYQSLMLPLLKYAGACKSEITTNEAAEVLAQELHLTEEDLEEDLREMLPSGVQSTFSNRVGWAATYMKKAGLLEPTRRGYYPEMLNPATKLHTSMDKYIWQ
jgi:restriction system protein